MNQLERSQIDFYSKKFGLYGDSPQALSWNDQESQFLRFSKISTLFAYEKGPFSVHEVGSGLGHFYEYLAAYYPQAHYSGNDIVPEFVAAAAAKYPKASFFQTSITEPLGLLPEGMKGKDFYCLSGTFHTKEENERAMWESFIFSTIRQMYELAGKGICVNFLTSHADFYNERLYYANPGSMLNWAASNLSRFVRIDHDLPLYEFSLTVFKPSYIETLYPHFKGRYGAK